MKEKKQNLTRFEFLLTLEGNIIIQRYFMVENHNVMSKNSLELYDCITNICDLISKDLAKKNFEYVYENQGIFLNIEDVDQEEKIKEEYFLLEIKQENDVFIQRIFPAHIYHPKARYSVDIRPRVREILGDLTDVLSMGSVETTYLDKNLMI